MRNYMQHTKSSSRIIAHEGGCWLHCNSPSISLLENEKFRQSQWWWQQASSVLKEIGIAAGGASHEQKGERVSGAGPKGWTRADWFPCRFFIYRRYILWLASDCRGRRVLMDGHSEFIAEFNNNSIGGSVAQPLLTLWTQQLVHYVQVQ